MSEIYGPEDATIPAWEAPTGSPTPAPAGRATTPPVGAAPPPGAPPRGAPTYRSWQPGFMPLRPLTLGDFISLPMKAIGFNRAVLFGGPMLCVIGILVAGVAAIALLAQDAGDWIRYGTTFDGVRPQTAIALGIALLVTLVTTAAAGSIVVPGVARGVLGERITLSQAWATARPRIPRVLLLYVIFSVPSFVLSFLYPNSYSSYSVDRYAAPPSGGETLLGLVSIPLSILLAILMYVATAVVILERIGSLRAIGRSVSLLRGNMWRFIGITIVIYFIVSFAGGAIGGIALVPLAIVLATTTSVQTVMVVGIIAAFVAVLLISVCVYSYFGTVGTLMYIDLRIRKEGFDVDLARSAEARSAR